MKTIAPHIHAAQYQQIKAMVQAITQQKMPEAKILADSTRQKLPSIISAPQDIQTLFFLNAISHRLDPQSAEVGNLYLMPDHGQQIKMFNFMAEKFPVVRFAQALVNAAHLAEIQTEQEIILLDIGIGSGQQMVRLMSQVAALPQRPQKINVIGIEPSPESLSIAEASLHKAARDQGLALQFTGVSKTLETLTTEDWQVLDHTIHNLGGKLLVNASFALHHINPPSFRAELFSRLHQYRPALVALIEPYADFLTSDLMERFDNAWHHYGLTFGAIDQIDATVEEKNTVKKIFFSREIQDVLAEESQRIERFETGEMWFERLIASGFQAYRLPNVEHQIPGCPFVTVHPDNGHVTLNVQGNPLVSIITVRSTASASPASP